MSDAAGMPEQRVGHDLACARCQYNLRTLPAAGACPECALPVAVSITFEREHPAGIRRAGAIVAFAVLAMAAEVLGALGAAWAMCVSVMPRTGNGAAALLYVASTLEYLSNAVVVGAALVLLWNAGPVRAARGRWRTVRALAVPAALTACLLNVFLALAAVPIIVFLVNRPALPTELVLLVYRARQWVQVLGGPADLAVVAILALYFWDLARTCRDRGMERLTVALFGVSLAANGAALLAEAYVLALWLVHGTTSSPTFRLLLQGLLVVELLLAGAFVGLYWPLVIRMVRRAPRAA